MLQDGLAAGLIGALVVAVVHGLADLASGVPLRTPSALGVLILEGAEAARVAEPGLEIAARFTVLHVAVWALLGVASSCLLSLVDARPRLASFVFAGFAFVFINLLYVSGALELPGFGALRLWLGTLLGSAGAAGWLAHRHPKLARHLEREQMTPNTRSELVRALAHETAVWIAARAGADRFPDSALVALADEKHERVRSLRALAQELDLAGIHDGNRPRPAWQAFSLEESLRAALALEHETIDLYDRFLAAVPELAIRDLFLRLRMRSQDEAIPTLERALRPPG